MKDKKSIIFHFLQKNHFAFDSMVFDGKSKTLILVQITLNENHDIHYDEIISYIQNNPEEKKIHANKIKYLNFFQDINKFKLVDTIIFQWMTNKKYKKIEDSAKIYNDKIKNHSKINFFFISPYHKGLLDDINKN